MQIVPSVQIKNVPADVHETLRRRAGSAGQSLQAYLLAQLIEQASRPTIAELFDRSGRQVDRRLPLEEAVQVIREERDARSS